MKINQVIKWLVACNLFCCVPVFALSPAGFWAAKDDSTGKVLSVIQIWQATDGRFDGRIYKIMDVVVNGKRQNPKDHCKACSGSLADKPILCMQVVYNMKATADYPNTWEDGQAYDPKSDNSYHAKMWFANNDDQFLNLRGYIMMPLFGRTQKWQRVSKPKHSEWVCSRSIENSYHK